MKNCEIIRCPQCGEKGFNISKKCQFCGYSINQPLKAQPNTSTEDSNNHKETNSNSDAIVGGISCGGIFLLFISFIIIMFIPLNKLLCDIIILATIVGGIMILIAVLIGCISKEQNNTDCDIDLNTDFDDMSAPKAHTPKCPTCGSTNISKISNKRKLVDAVLWTIPTKNQLSTFECNNCGYKW